MDWQLKHARSEYGKPTIRAASKRRLPGLNRRWIVEASRAATRWIGGPGGQWIIDREHIIVTCNSHCDAIKIAHAISVHGPIDHDLIVNLARRWGR